MNAIQAKMKGWVKAIGELQIEGITAELEEQLDGSNREQADKMLFKLLLHLSHAAHACDRKKLDVGMEIWKLARYICLRMSKIPDRKRFLLSILHVAKCLQSMRFYDEAMKLYDCTFTKENLEADCALSDISLSNEMCSLASNQWNSTVCNDLLKKVDPTNDDQCRNLIRVVGYGLKMAMLASPKYSRTVLERLVLYRKQTRTISKQSGKSILESRFETFLMDFLSANKISVDDENAVETLRLICQLITETVVSSVTKTGMSTAKTKSSLFVNIFRSSFDGNVRCFECFDLYRHICKTLLRPIDSLDASAVADIEDLTSVLRKTILRFGYEGLTKAVLYPAYSLFSPLLTYWEESAKMKSPCLTNDLVVAAMKFFSLCSDAFDTYEPSFCRCDSDSCLMNRDVFSAVALRMKSLAVVSRAMSLRVTNELYEVALEFTVSSLPGITLLKESGCKRWSELWSLCGAYLYNMGVSCEPEHYEYSVQLHSSLCTNLIRLEGLAPAKSIVNLKDPLCDVLHRLTSVHWNHARYEKASIFCALNGLLSCEKTESRAYRYWANIKRKHPESHGVTMLKFLRANSDEISKILPISVDDYDKIAMCLREIKGLQEAKVDLSSSIIAAVDELERLNPSPAQYAQAVHLLGYHLLSVKHETSVSKYVKKVMLRYESEANPSVSFQWYYGHAQLYKLVERIAEITRRTLSEIGRAGIRVAASSTDSDSSSLTVSANVVPTYSTLNMRVTTELAEMLKLALRRWEQALGSGFKDTLKDWETAHALHIVTIAGEYAQLYNFDNLAARAWKLAYRLAVELKDDKTIIYATSRRLSSLEIDPRWIARANESAKALDDASANETVARYWLCLANFYFMSHERTEAKRCMEQASANIGGNFLVDITNYLLRNDIVLNHMWNEDYSDDHQSIYQRIIVEIFYGLLTLNSTVGDCQYGSKEKQLYDCDALIEYTNKLTVRANSLLSFQEISAHLNLRLAISQEMGAALRVAECLISLCYIDLSRVQLDECEVKLQGLEHILDIKGSSLSVNSNSSTDSTKKTSLPTSPIGAPEGPGAGQSDASPILRRKRFTAPEFMLHGTGCRCFKCTNKRYRYLVFACTHLRAYQYTLQRHNDEAGEHFKGAFEIWKFNRSRDSATRETAGKIENVPIRHQETLHYVMLHLDYCRFMKFNAPSKKTEIMRLSHEALELCGLYHLKDHPIYMSVNEFILEYRLEQTFVKGKHDSFMVPAIEDIDISAYVDEPVKHSVVVSTPAGKVVDKKMKSVRRRKTPPFLKLNKVPIDLTEDDDEVGKVDVGGGDDEPPISTSPTSSTKRVRRKITDQDYSGEGAKLAGSVNKFSAPKIKVTTAEEKAPAKGKQRKDSKSSDRDNAVGGVSSIASISLNSVGEQESFEISQSPGKIDELIGMIEQLEVRPQPQSSTRTRIRTKSQQGSASSSSSSSSISELSSKPCETMKKVSKLHDEVIVAKPSSKTGKSAKNSDCRGSKKSSLVSTGENTNTLSSDDAGDTANDGRRTSARLRKKSDDLSIPKSSSLKSSDKSGGSASNSEDEVVTTSTRTRKRTASSTTVEAITEAKEVSKSTRARATKKVNENPQGGRKTDG